MRAFVVGALLLVWVPLASLPAQGTKPRENVSKYSAQAQIGPLGVAAELWGHYIPIKNSSLRTNAYFVVEVALFAPPEVKVPINAGQFVLRINEQRLLPVSPGLVTSGYLFPDMRERTARLETDANVGPVVVVTGRDPAQPKFPGDSNPANAPLPPSRNPAEEIQGEPLDPVKAVADSALPEGSHATPISGYLFFAYSAKLKRVKHAKVDYSGPMGKATLSLR